VQSNLLALTRANWSMPPDHGAAIVRVILDTDELRSSWLAELAQMAARIRHVRTCLAEADGTLAPLRAQQGMFSTLALSSEQVLRLRADHGVYMPASGRINVAGLTAATVSTFVRALASVN
jgi:aromatic-amino-acid transaminase